MDEIRSDGYEIFRTRSNWEINTCSVNDALTDLQVSSFTIEEDKVGRSLPEGSGSDPPIAVARKDQTIRELDDNF